MEELLAQLLQMRAAQTMSESAARQQVVLGQVARKPAAYKPKPMPGMAGNGWDPWTGELMQQRTEAGVNPWGIANPGKPNVQVGKTGAARPSDNDEAFLSTYGVRGIDSDLRPEPSDLYTAESEQRDDDVSTTGWLPGDFQGMSPYAAAALIADQLRTHRIRTMGQGDPEYMAKLPVY